MPLVVFCGIPASGKTTLARLLHEKLSKNRKVVIVNDEDTGQSRSDLYRDSLAEKSTRSLLKASIQRELTDDVVVIADSLNYIKGYRYELFCIAREVGTQLVVVCCATTGEEAKRRNTLRRELGQDAFDDNTLDGLLLRFEAPNEMNRWERPLFLADNTDRPLEDFRVDIDDVTAAIFDKGRTLRPNQATTRPGVSSTDALRDLDKAMQCVEKQLIDRLNDAREGDSIAVPPATVQVILTRKPTVAELRRLRRAYLKLAHIHRPGNQTLASIANEFVEHLNRQLGDG